MNSACQYTYSTQYSPQNLLLKEADYVKNGQIICFSLLVTNILKDILYVNIHVEYQVTYLNCNS